MQRSGPKLGGSGTERAASVEMRPGGSPPRWEAGADKASSSAVAGGMSGMLRGPAKLAKLADRGNVCVTSVRYSVVSCVIRLQQLLKPVGFAAASCSSCFPSVDRGWL